MDNGNRNQGKQGVRAGQAASGERMFYSTVACLQAAGDISRLDGFQDKGDHEGLLRAAREYYDGNGIYDPCTFASPIQGKGDVLLAEDGEFAVVRNNIDGTYEVMLKLTEREIRDHVTKYGTCLASDDIKEVARDMVEEQFSAMTEQQMPVLEMPNGDVLHVRYDRKTDTIDVGTVTNAELAVSYSFAYDYDNSLDSNLQSVNEKLNGMGRYQEEKVR